MGRRRKGLAINGWVIVDKSVGITSTQAVGKVRWLFNANKAGHAGTLDPLASGLLPIALGEATKVISHVFDAPKEYRFTVKWGEARNTDDGEGEVVSQSDARPTKAEIEAVLGKFVGKIEQTPPKFSAIKVDGARAYDLARDGQDVELVARTVQVDELKLVATVNVDHTDFEMRCGKGTYVRAIARDLGQMLGCFGHIVQLRRTIVGPFTEKDAISLDKLEDLRHKGALDEVRQSVETALVDIPALAVTGAEAKRLQCGQSLRVPSQKEGTVYVTAEDQLVAMAQLHDGELRPVRVFNI